MISVRVGIFETNSSSCHRLIIPLGQSFTVPKKVRLTEGYSAGIDFVLSEIEDSGHPESWIRFLYASGVEEIEYTGTNVYVKRSIEANKGVTDYGYLPDIPGSSGVLPRQIYLLLLFGEDTQYLEHSTKYEEPEEYNGQCFVFNW